jgi:hypothetical protein
VISSPFHYRLKNLHFPSDWGLRAWTRICTLLHINDFRLVLYDWWLPIGSKCVWGNCSVLIVH